MPGMGPLGSITASDFYLYLGLDLAIIAGLAWIAHSWKLGMPTSKPNDPLARHLLSSRSRIFLRRGLGALWVVDGLLQAQPLLATRFGSLVLAPVVHSQPSWLAQVLALEIRLWQARPLDLAAGTVLVQIGIGVAILAGGDSRLGRLGLWFSIGWALAVWFGGEALGGLLVMGASEIFGAPGAALLYAMAAALLLAPTRLWVGGSIPRGIRRGVGVFLLLGALLQALPFEGFWSGSGLHSAFSRMARMPQPHWLGAPIFAMAKFGATHPTLENGLLTGVMAILGLGLVSGRATRSWTGLVLVWLAATWWLGQGLGGLGTGAATDPNLAPLVALLLVSAWIRTQAEPVRSGARSPGILDFRRKLALGGLAALVVGVVPAVVGLPLAAIEASSPSAAISSAHVVRRAESAKLCVTMPGQNTVLRQTCPEAGIRR